MTPRSSAPKLSYQEFRDIAKLELSGVACIAHQELVRRPENAVRWLRVLNSILQAVQHQNAAAKSHLHAHPGRLLSGGGELKREYHLAFRKYEHARARREEVLKHIADRVAEAKDIIIEQDAISAQALERLARRLLRCDTAVGPGRRPRSTGHTCIERSTHSDASQPSVMTTPRNKGSLNEMSLDPRHCHAIGKPNRRSFVDLLSRLQLLHHRPHIDQVDLLS